MEKFNQPGQFLGRSIIQDVFLSEICFVSVFIYISWYIMFGAAEAPVLLSPL